MKARFDSIVEISCGVYLQLVLVMAGDMFYFIHVRDMLGIKCV